MKRIAVNRRVATYPKRRIADKRPINLLCWSFGANGQRMTMTGAMR